MKRTHLTYSNKGGIFLGALDMQNLRLGKLGICIKLTVLAPHTEKNSIYNFKLSTGKS